MTALEDTCNQAAGRVILGNTPETPENADSGANRGHIPGFNLGRSIGGNGLNYILRILRMQ